MKIKIKIDSADFSVQNSSGYSDKTVEKHFANFVNSHHCPPEYVASDRGDEFLAISSPAKGEKIKFISRL